MAEALLKLQRESFERLEDIIRETSLALPSLDASQPASVAQALANTIAALRSQSRQRETAGRQRRELAEAMVIGSLINRDNPDWDLFDPSTSRESGESLILALLHMQLPDPAAAGQ